MQCGKSLLVMNMGKFDKKKIEDNTKKSIRIFVSDSVHPLNSAAIYIDSAFVGDTDEEGSFTILLEKSVESIEVRVVHPGYVTALETYELTYANTQIIIRLVELEKPTQQLPTKQFILDNLQTNIAMTNKHGEKSEWFTGALPLWDVAKRKEFYARFHDRGLKAVFFNLVMDYDAYGKYDLTTDIQKARDLMDECYDQKLIPWICLQLVDENNRGYVTVSRLHSVLDQLKDKVRAAFIGWETTVTDSNSQYTPNEILSVCDIYKQVIPDGILGIEFAQPASRLELIHYDGRGSITNAIDWWKAANKIDVLLAELPYDYIYQFNKLIAEVGGLFCRIEKLFSIPFNYPDGNLISQETRDNWKTNWGINKKFCLFEYAAFLRETDQFKSELRHYIQKVVPLTAYGEG